MSEFPILFNTEMVLAILDGRKTATRRVIKYNRRGIAIQPPHKGDLLYVRETWAPDGESGYLYRADANPNAGGFIRDKNGKVHAPRWRPSIHMPKEAARIWLKVTDVRAEDLRDITEADAVKEGLYKGWSLGERGSLALTARQAFMWLWMHLTGKGPPEYTWACNPRVWVIEFERCEKPGR